MTVNRLPGNLDEEACWKRYALSLEKRLDEKEIDYSDLKNRCFSERNRLKMSEQEVLKTVKPWQPVAGLLSGVQNSREMKQRIRTFAFLFGGRNDLYARRSANGHYYPKCRQFYHQGICPKVYDIKSSCLRCTGQDYEPLSMDILEQHLSGNGAGKAPVIGRYLLLEKETAHSDREAKVLVFDFDNHNESEESLDWKKEADVVRRICRENNIFHFAEISGSGKGAHIWICFYDWIPAKTIRKFGKLLLDQAAREIPMVSFKAYDRMFPSQNDSPGPGSLIALPLQAEALKRGNTAFVDENWNPYQDQWQALLSYQKIDRQFVECCMTRWQEPYSSERSFLSVSKSGKTVEVNIGASLWNSGEMWRMEDTFGPVKIVLDGKIEISRENIAPRLQNQIRALAAYENQEYFRALRAGRGVWNKNSIVDLGLSTDKTVILPPGLLDTLLAKLQQAGIETDYSDCRNFGEKFPLRFKGEFRSYQKKAFDELIQYYRGILEASTGAGKTFIGAALAAHFQVPVLVLCERENLLLQWKSSFEEFLAAEGEGGQLIPCSEWIGEYYGKSKRLTGKLDIGLVQSLRSKENLQELLQPYGMVIIDECHHAASRSTMKILASVRAGRVYGLSATPLGRSDGMGLSSLMMIGPIRYTFSQRDKQKEFGIHHKVYFRYSSLVSFEKKLSFREAEKIAADDENRNQMILSDVKKCIEQQRTPLVLTSLKEHAKLLFEKLREITPNTFLLYGGNSQKENMDQLRKMKAMKKDEPLILVGTKSMIGEGFSFDRLDSIFLTLPVSSEASILQQIGRIDRKEEGKNEVWIFDYADPGISIFTGSFHKRLKVYDQNGWSIENRRKGKQKAKSIFNAKTWKKVFSSDLEQAEKTILIVSGNLDIEPVHQLIDLSLKLTMSSVKITVVCHAASALLVGNGSMQIMCIHRLEQAGIQVLLSEKDLTNYAVIDDDLIWYGDTSFLAENQFACDLIRVHDVQAASELRQFAFMKKSQDSFRNGTLF